MEGNKSSLKGDPVEHRSGIESDGITPNEAPLTSDDDDDDNRELTIFRVPAGGTRVATPSGMYSSPDTYELGLTRPKSPDVKTRLPFNFTDPTKPEAPKKSPSENIPEIPHATDEI